MIDEAKDELKVSFPASVAFTRIGRVAVAGLALRLGVEIDVVERLRLAVDTAVNALLGSGRISMLAHWEPEVLRISLSNPDATVNGGPDLADQLTELVGSAVVEGSSIVLELAHNASA